MTNAAKAQREAVHLAGLAGKMEHRYAWGSQPQAALSAAKRAERAEQAQAKALELGLPSSAQGYELTYNDLGTSYKYVMHDKKHKKAQTNSYRAYVKGIVKQERCARGSLLRQFPGQRRRGGGGCRRVLKVRLVHRK